MKKRFLSMMMVVVMAAGLVFTGCSSAPDSNSAGALEQNNNQGTENSNGATSGNDANAAQQTGNQPADAQEGDWVEAYKATIDDLAKATGVSMDKMMCLLYNFDCMDNKVPELIMASSANEDAVYLYTWKDGKVIDLLSGKPCAFICVDPTDVSKANMLAVYDNGGVFREAYVLKDGEKVEFLTEEQAEEKSIAVFLSDGLYDNYYDETKFMKDANFFLGIYN